MKHSIFKQKFRDLLPALVYPAVFLASLVLMVFLLHGCSREDNPTVKVGNMGQISFIASSGNQSAGTKSSSGDVCAEGEGAGSYGESGYDASLGEGGYEDYFGEEDLASVEEEEDSFDEDATIYQFYHNFPVENNSQIKSAGGSSAQSSDTRFSGEVISVYSSNYERVDWLPGKDRITIAEAVSGNSCEYEVRDVSSSGNLERSRARLSTISEEELKWQDGSDHKFVAFYPSLALIGLPSTAMALENTSSSYGANLSGTFDVIPSVQYCYKEGTTRIYNGVNGSTPAETWYEPDMKYAYMAAFKAVGPSGVGKDVTLDFSPCFSAVEVKLLKPSTLTSAVTLESAVLRAGKGSGNYIDTMDYLPITLSGNDFNFQMSSSGIGYSADPSNINSKVNQESEITLYFRNNKTATTNVAPTLSATVPISFTFLLLPVDIPQLELDVNLKVAGVAVTNTITLRTVNEVTGEKSWIPLEKGKKLTITNMEIDKDPRNIYKFETPDVVDIYANTEYTSASAPFSVRSYRVNTRGNKTRIAYTAEFSLSEDGPWYKSSQITQMPEELQSIVYAPSFNTVKNANGWNAKVGVQPGPYLLVKGNPVKYLVSDDRANRASDLRNRPVNGYTMAEPQNLALMDPLTGVERSPISDPFYPGEQIAPFRSANCYIIQKGGWYMLPLVMGNYLDYKETWTESSPCKNAASIRSTVTANWNQYYLKNYLNQDPQAGFVGWGTGVLMTESLPNYLEAVILWQDVAEEDGFLEIPLGSAETTSAGHGLFLPESEYHNYKVSRLNDEGRGTYLRFRIDESKIQEGNIVIAVREKEAYNSQKRILWSWHIWVTAENLSVSQFNLYPQDRRTEDNRLLNVPLGWNREKTYGFPERRFYMKLTQSSSGKEKVIEVIQHANNNHIVGNAPYYQWGRKDPFLPGEPPAGTANYGTNKVWSSPGGYNIVGTQGNYGGLYTGASYDEGNQIQNPNRLAGNSTRSVWRWSTRRTPADGFSHTNPLKNDTIPMENYYTWVKTIQDPCPPGFTVPNAYLGFGAKKSRYNVKTGYYYNFNVVWEKGSDFFGTGGVYFKRNPTDTEGIFFPALGHRDYYYYDENNFYGGYYSYTSNGRLSRNLRNPYMTQSFYLNDYTYTRQVQVGEETQTQTATGSWFEVGTFSFGLNSKPTINNTNTSATLYGWMAGAGTNMALPVMPAVHTTSGGAYWEYNLP